MTIRPATLSDASSLAAISVEVWLGTYLKHGVHPRFAEYVLETFTAANLAKQFSDPAETFLVSENTEGPDGFIRMTTPSAAPIEGGPNVEISTFYVQPRHHGCGVGGLLLDAAFAYCRAQNWPAVWLATNAQNTPAIGFYLAKGFHHAGETHFRMGAEAYLNNVYIYDRL